MVAVPSPLSVNVRPSGSASLVDSAGAGEPVAITVNVPAVPTAKIVDESLVITGPCPTSIVSTCIAAGAVWFVAVTVTGCVPPSPAAGVPVIVAVPLPLSVKLKPFGSVPLSANVGWANPVVVIVND